MVVKSVFSLDSEMKSNIQKIRHTVIVSDDGTQSDKVLEASGVL